MARNEKVIGLRFDEDILGKLDYLIEEDRNTAQRMGVTQRSRRQIIEDALKDCYYRKINETQDGDVVERLSGMVADQVSAAMSGIVKDIEEILFLAIKNDLGNRVFYRSPSVLPAPDSKAQAIEVIVNEESMWDLALEEYLMNRWARENVHLHEVQEDGE